MLLSMSRREFFRFFSSGASQNFSGKPVFTIFQVHARQVTELKEAFIIEFMLV